MAEKSEAGAAPRGGQEIARHLEPPSQDDSAHDEVDPARFAHVPCLPRVAPEEGDEHRKVRQEQDADVRGPEVPLSERTEGEVHDGERREAAEDEAPRARRAVEGERRGEGDERVDDDQARNERRRRHRRVHGDVG